MQETQFKEERIIISLNPDFNPTGNKHPNTIKKEMKSDPDFLELSEDEQKALFKKVDSLISTMDDIKKYGTLSEMVEEASRWGHGNIRYQKNLIVSLNELNDKLKYSEFLSSKYIDGNVLNAGEVIAKLTVQDNDYPCFSYLVIWEMIMPFTGRVFALTDFDNTVGHYKSWNQDLFVIGGMNDTRKDAIAWYKEVTGKIVTYKSDEELAEEKQASAQKVNKFASKWGI